MAGLNITLCELDLMDGVYTLWEHTLPNLTFYVQVYDTDIYSTLPNHQKTMSNYMILQGQCTLSTYP